MLNGSETRANRNGHSVWNERCKNFYKSIEYSLHRRQTNNKKWNVFVMIAALADHRSPHSRIHSTWLSSVSIRSHSVWFEIGDSVLFFFYFFFTLPSSLICTERKNEMRFNELLRERFRSDESLIWLDLISIFSTQIGRIIFSDNPQCFARSLHREHVPATRINLNFYHESQHNELI